MHSCYSPCTNEDLNLGFSNLNHLTRLLLSLALSRCFSAEQMGKRPPMDEWSKYLYPSFKTNRWEAESALYKVTGRSGQGDRMLRSVIPTTLSERAVKF